VDVGQQPREQRDDRLHGAVMPWKAVFANPTDHVFKAVKMLLSQSSERDMSGRNVPFSLIILEVESAIL
jgi:hypothetical protein